MLKYFVCILSYTEYIWFINDSDIIIVYYIINDSDIIIVYYNSQKKKIVYYNVIMSGTTMIIPRLIAVVTYFNTF